MFDFTLSIFNLCWNLLMQIWSNPMFLGFCGFFILSFIFKVLYELVGYNKC